MRAVRVNSKYVNQSAFVGRALSGLAGGASRISPDSLAALEKEEGGWTLTERKETGGS